MSDPKHLPVTVATIIVVLSLVAGVLGFYAFRELGRVSAEEQAGIAAEMVRENLTSTMINGTINRRGAWMDGGNAIPNLKETYVLRGPSVVRQFGAGRNRERRPDETSARVLADGVPRFEEVEIGGEPALRATIPYIADSRAEPSCLSCHDAEPGAILGAVRVTVSIGAIRRQARLGMEIVGGAIALITLAGFYFLRRYYTPLTSAVNDMRRVIKDATTGDFSVRMDVSGDTEARQMAEPVNRLMATLQDEIDGLRRKVSELLRYPVGESRNMLAATMEVVDGLVEASRFKQEISEDETKEEVYRRLANTIRHRFDLKNFSIYEVANSRNRIVPIIVDSETPTVPRWCDQQIMVRADSCRACRTGHVVDGAEYPNVCQMFRPEGGGRPQAVHVCLPIVQSGAVGCVIQLVIDPDESQLVHYLLPFLKVYMREAAPVLEAKRLMQSLRETTMRDQLTGLYNRRFLEEYVETLVAGARRRARPISVVIFDLDHFKKVNDTYGHATGDKLLVEISRVIRQNLRASDVAVRYGGEEFLAVLPDSDREGGMEAAEKVRRAVENMSMQVAGMMLNQTISAGVAEFPGDGDTFWQVVEYADLALYRAKHAGRNLTIRFTPDLAAAHPAGGWMASPVSPAPDDVAK